MFTKFTQKGQDGFSLLELVVAVGVLLALSVGGFLAYSGHVHRAKVGVTEAAAQEVYTGAHLAREQGKPVKTAETEFNATTTKIATTANETPNGICTFAQHADDEDIHASRGECSGESGTVTAPKAKLALSCAQATHLGPFSSQRFYLGWTVDGEQPKNYVVKAETVGQGPHEKFVSLSSLSDEFSVSFDTVDDFGIVINKHLPIEQDYIFSVTAQYENYEVTESIKAHASITAFTLYQKFSCA